jgi:chromate transporter
VGARRSGGARAQPSGGARAQPNGGTATLATSAPTLAAVLAEWGRIGCIGFGGPPAHIALLRDLCVERRRWIADGDFEDALAACNLLPGPASTQMAIYCGWSVRGPLGAVVGGLAFVVPGLLVIVGLAAIFLAASPPTWIVGAGAGGGAAVAAVALQAGSGLLPASWRRSAAKARWAIYLAAGTLAAATVGPWVVLVLLGCGVAEIAARALTGGRAPSIAPLVAIAVGGGKLLSLAWVAFKVGALSYGGGFVIIPLMQSDAVDRHHWMTDGQFLDAVALGQITPGPVVHTVAVVGYAAAGVGGALLAAVIAFAPSFAFILLGAARFDRLRQDRRARAFLDGAGPAAIGAILGSSIPLAEALSEAWQFVVLGVAAVVLVVLRRSVVATLLAAAATGVVVALAGGPVPG